MIDVLRYIVETDRFLPAVGRLLHNVRVPVCHNLPLKASGCVDVQLSAHDAFVE